MMTRLAIDPITRIEGHLRLEVEHADGKVQDVWSSGTMFRGIELILAGRDPRDAWAFAQRVCGVCTHVHALASVRAVEDALGITVPPNAQLIRNLMHATQLVHDHVVHFYHLHALDWVDVVSAVSADPTATARLCRHNNPGWPRSTKAYFTDVRDRLKRYVASGQLGPFAGGYWGHPAYRLTPEANLLAVAHYLEALEWQRDIIRIHAILGGKNPHPNTFVVGGMAVEFAPDSPAGVNAAALDDLAVLARRAKRFVNLVLLPDVRLIASAYVGDWTTLGGGLGNFMAYGDLVEPGAAASQPFLPRGRIVGRDLTQALEVDQRAIAETVARSWYRYTSGDDGLKHPYEGETIPAYTGPTPPYDHITTPKYSWLKAPRYDGVAYEVGPLARMVIGYAQGRGDIRAAVDDLLGALGLPMSALFSTIGRLGARAVETQLVVDRMSAWVAQLKANQRAGELAVADTTLWEPATWPNRAQGWGAVEAPRGALGHWIRIADGKVANYQMVVPTTWNGSPRDAVGARGAWESALVGTPLADPGRPLEILRTVHSFDPCMGCSVHVYDPAGGDDIEIEVA
jgi:hydrogenase large subunit